MRRPCGGIGKSIDSRDYGERCERGAGDLFRDKFLLLMGKIVGEENSLKNTYDGFLI